MIVYLKSDFAPAKEIKAKKVFYDVALQNLAVYHEEGGITIVDLKNTHYIKVY